MHKNFHLILSAIHVLLVNHPFEFYHSNTLICYTIKVRSDDTVFNCDSSFQNLQH